jgi:hypothetical protein
VDIDAGIRDSIKDIHEAIRLAGFTRANDRESADVVLIVLGRGIVNLGSVGSSSGFSANGRGYASGFVVPYNRPTISSVLQVGTYERGMQSEAGTWRDAAKSVLEDVAAWWEANKAAVERGR